MGRQKKEFKEAGQLNLFVTNAVSWSPKSDIHSMEHPFFSLSKRKDVKPRHYVSPDGKTEIHLTPSVKGLATIWDQDILLYAMTLLKDKINAGEIIKNEPISLLAYNFLTATNRSTGGESYDRLFESLERLQGTLVKTNIKTGDIETTESFSFVQGVKMIKEGKKVTKFEFKLSDWSFNALVSDLKEMLTLSREYFEILGGLERRLYSLARKHCGRQPEWSIFLHNLHTKTGASCSLREFRRMTKEIVQNNNLPDYLMSYREKEDKITFYSKSYKGIIPALAEGMKA